MKVYFSPTHWWKYLWPRRSPEVLRVIYWLFWIFHFQPSKSGYKTLNLISFIVLSLAILGLAACTLIVGGAS